MRRIAILTSFAAFAASCASPPPPAPVISTVSPDQVEVRVVRLQNTEAAKLAPVLEKLLAKEKDPAEVVPHSGVNALLLSGRHDQVERAMRLIARLDVRA